MEPCQQANLLEIPEQPPAPAGTPVAEGAGATRPKLKPIDRSQGLLRPVIVEELVAADHKVRAIWDLTGTLPMTQFLAPIKTREGQSGRAAWNPQLLLSVWIYAYSEGVTSAREVERLMEYEPGLMWLAGLGEVNYHTLSDFRVEHNKALNQLLTEFLGLLSKEGLVTLELVAHDGTKIRAQAGGDSFRREKKLNEEMAKAQQMVEQLNQAAGQDEEEGNRPRAARQQAIAQERQQRMKQAAEELEKIRAGKRKEPERQEARVSLTEPEARLMKHGDAAIVPSYNVQLSTDAAHNIVVGVQVTQCAGDSGSLLPAMEEIQERAGQYPRQVVADGGFTNQAAMEGMQGKEIDFYGSLPAPEVRQAASMKAAGIAVGFAPSAFVIVGQKEELRCPAGKTLAYLRHSKKRGQSYHQYQAAAGVCSSCEFQKKCCPKKPEQGRTVSIRISEPATTAAFREKMKGDEAKAIYRRRGAVAEFPNCWIKEKLKVRKFRLRGLAKATTEALWAVLTYDVMQWVRLSWKPTVAAALGSA